MPDSVSETWSSKEEDILNPQPSYWLLCIATKKKKKQMSHTYTFEKSRSQYLCRKASRHPPHFKSSFPMLTHPYL